MASRYEVENPNKLTKTEMAAVVRRASKAANQRLRELERNVREGKEETKGEAYAYMERLLADQQRNRFKERTASMTIQELRQEYKRVTSFLSMKSSTAKGRAELSYAKFKSYSKRGFVGSEDEFKDIARKLWAKHVVDKYSSQTIYEVITSGSDKLIKEWMEKADDIDAQDSKTAGKELLAVLREKFNL